MNQRDRDALAALARNATPGPWRASGVTVETNDRLRAPVAKCIVERLEDNAAYLAACSPERILALLARVERLETALGDITTACGTLSLSDANHPREPMPQMLANAWADLNKAMAAASAALAEQEPEA